MKKTRVMIVDDHQVVRKGVEAILAGRADFEICGEAATGREALAAAVRLKPDLVVMDISMPEMNGLEATRQILKRYPQAEVLILSMHESEQLVRDVLLSGARGYLLKDDAGSDLLAALEALREHKLYFTSRVGDVVLKGYLRPSADVIQTDTTPVSQLTPREREIVQLVAEGKSSKEIATRLGISLKTVETHRAHILQKLDLHSIGELVRYAIRNNIVAC